jgi:hypothetical protein
VSTRTEGGTVVITVVYAHAVLGAGDVRLMLSVREGPARTWRYGLAGGTHNRVRSGRVVGIDGHLDALRFAAGVCRDAYEPGTAERGLLEQFAADDPPRPRP